MLFHLVPGSPRKKIPSKHLKIARNQANEVHQAERLYQKRSPSFLPLPKIERMVQEEKKQASKSWIGDCERTPWENPIHFFGFLFVQLGVFRFPREDFFRGIRSQRWGLGSYRASTAGGGSTGVSFVELDRARYQSQVVWGGLDGGGMGGNGIYVCVYTCMSKNSGVDWKKGTS